MSEQYAQNLKSIAHVQLNNQNKTMLKRKNNNNMDLPCEPIRTKQNRSNYYAVLDTEEYDKELFQKYSNHVNMTQNVEKKLKVIPVNKYLNDIPVNQDNSVPITQKNNSPKSYTKQNTNAKNNNKVPPINIINVESKVLIEFLKNCLKIEMFKVKEYRDKKTLYMSNLEDFYKVKAFLEKSNTNFYTFTPKSNKTKSLLIKGLDITISCEEILEELKTYEDEDLKFTKVSLFKTKRSSSQGYQLPIFMVQISSDSNVNKAKNIRAILYRCIKWEQIKKPEIPQCRNCQGFFHSAANCYLPSKCVKCKETHTKGQCTIMESSEENKEKLYCVVCQKYGHPASYKGCQKYKELQEKLRQRKKIFNQNKTINNNSFINPNVSFSSILKNPPNQDINNNFYQSNDTTNKFLVELKDIVSNMSKQIIEMQNQINIQASKINSIFSMVGI